jgi:hypothetical protein
MVTTRRSRQRNGENDAGAAGEAVAAAEVPAEAEESAGSPAAGSTRMNGSRTPRLAMNGSHRPCVPAGRDSDTDADSDGGAPDVEVTADARARDERLVAAEATVRDERKSRRRERSKAQEAAAKVRKEAKAKREKAKKGREEAAGRVLPQEVLDRAASAAELEAARSRTAGQKRSLESQSGTLRLVAKHRLIDGLEVVDASVSAAQRSSSTASASKRARHFIGRCLYGSGAKRVSSSRVAAATRRAKSTRRNGKQRLGKRVAGIDKGRGAGIDKGRGARR